MLKKNTLLKATLSLGLVLGLGGTAVANASSWTVSSVTVSSGGHWSTYGEKNLKETNSNVASFNGDSQPAKFGCMVHLINSHAETRSDTVGLYLNQTTHAGNNSGTKNYYYYADVRSHRYELSTTRVKLHFSSDRK